MKKQGVFLLGSLLLCQGTAEAFFCFSFGTGGGGRNRAHYTPPMPVPPGYSPAWGNPWALPMPLSYATTGAPTAAPIAIRSRGSTSESTPGAGQAEPQELKNRFAPLAGESRFDDRSGHERDGPYRFRPVDSTAGNQREL